MIVNAFTTCYAVNSYICCDFTVDFCFDEPCQNGGTCQLTSNGYNCQCAAGYLGSDCEISE